MKEKSKRTAATRKEQQSQELSLLKEAQLADPEIKLVREWVEKEWTAVSGMSNRIKSYWSQFERLCIHDDYLCRIWYEGKKPERYQIIIPKSLRETVLEQCHDSLIGGHFGIRKTLEKVRQKYYWAGLYKYIEQYVKSCYTCNRRKSPPRVKRAPMKLTGAGYPMERIATDVLDQYSDSTYKNKNTETDFQKVVHVDRMRRRYVRSETQELSQHGEGEQKEATVEDRRRSEYSFEIDHEEDSFFDAQAHIEETEELGRGKRKSHLPTKISDYVL